MGQNRIVSVPFNVISNLVRSLLRGWVAIVGHGIERPTTERDHVRNFLEFIDDRRVLFTPYFLEYPAHVIVSVHQIEERAGVALTILPRRSPASPPIARILSACSAFLGLAAIRNARSAAAPIPSDTLFYAVVALRKSLTKQAGVLADAFALDLPRELSLAA